mmetsp:Transcript_465/g.888  ORF Transcript_465/g.888 Transcript_465/m.888 type:complete len:505 (-) Transcript_465:189-1703(-)
MVLLLVPPLPDDMTSSANDKETPSPVASGTTSSVSSDLTTSSHRQTTSETSSFINNAAGGGASDSEGRWYYYLTNDGAKRLPHYQYQGADLSLLYKYVLSPLAAWLVDNVTPSWLAPNSITLLGLAWMVLSYVVIWFWCPGMYEANTDLGSASAYAVPSVIFLLNGCAMLIYQTLDNMDGKQARKTGSSSPLGLLFDHGCDAFNSILGSANWIAAMAMVPGNVSDLLGTEDHGNIQSKSLLSEYFGGDAMLASLLILCPMVAFYISTWEQYYTGKLVLPPFNGPSEGLAMGASLSIISFLWGPMYWQGTSLADAAIDRLDNEQFASLQGRVRNMDLIILASIIGLAQEVFFKTFFVTRAYGFQTLRTAVPNLLLVSSTLTMIHLDQTLLLRIPRVMMHLISGLFTEQTAQLMLDHMVGEDSEIRKRWCLFPLVVLAAVMTCLSVPPAALDQTLLAYTAALWVYIAFKIRVQLYEICDVLGIWCFDIVTPHPKRLSRDESAKKEN